MKQPDLSVVIYIAATPVRAWATMLDPAFTRQFFGLATDVPWAPGAEIRSFAPDGTLDAQARVVECDPPRRLSLTWLRARIAGEMRAMPAAVATIVIEPLGDVIRVTATETHDEPVDAGYLDGGRTGWPIALSRLKTLLETGRPLPPIRPG